MRNIHRSSGNKTIKIAFVSLTYPPVPGGIASHLAEVAKELAKHGFEVHVLTKWTPGNPIIEHTDNLVIHRFKSHGRGYIARISFLVKSVVCFFQIKPCLVHSHEIFLPTTTSLIYKLLTNTPIVTTIHASGLIYSEVEALKRSTLGFFRQYWLSRFIDYFIAISRTIEKELGTMGISDSKIVPIPNGIDMDRFVPSSDSERMILREQLGLPKGFIVIYTGRLVGPKRVGDLIEIWPNIRRVYPEATLLIVGTGPDEDDLRQSAGSGIIFSGNIQNVATY